MWLGFERDWENRIFREFQRDGTHKPRDVLKNHGTSFHEIRNIWTGRDRDFENLNETSLDGIGILELERDHDIISNPEEPPGFFQREKEPPGFFQREIIPRKSLEITWHQGVPVVRDHCSYSLLLLKANIYIQELTRKNEDRK